jgi:crotonobetainyl-CoA:carnitine CoA-transferase CaiB-like acyl-CoA transferase
VRQLGPSRNKGIGGMLLNTNRGKRAIAIDLNRADGRDVLLQLQPRFATHAARHAQIDEIYREVGRIFLARTTAEWREQLERADIPVMPMHTLESILEDPHLAAAGFFRQGAVRLPPSPPRLK